MNDYTIMAPPLDPEGKELHSGILKILEEYGINKLSHSLFVALLNVKSLEEAEKEEENLKSTREKLELVKYFFENKEILQNGSTSVIIKPVVERSFRVNSDVLVQAMLKGLEQYFHSRENWKDFDTESQTWSKKLSDKQYIDVALISLSMIKKRSARPYHLRRAVILVYLPLKTLLPDKANETLAEVILRLFSLKNYSVRTRYTGRKPYDFANYSINDPKSRKEKAPAIKTVREIIEDFIKRGNNTLLD